MASLGITGIEELGQRFTVYISRDSAGGIEGVGLSIHSGKTTRSRLLFHINKLFVAVTPQCSSLLMINPGAEVWVSDEKYWRLFMCYSHLAPLSAFFHRDC